MNSFDYLVELQRHALELAAHPARHEIRVIYRETLAKARNSPIRQSYDQSRWPKRIVFCKKEASLENGRKTGFSKAEITKGYWRPHRSPRNRQMG